MNQENKSNEEKWREEFVIEVAKKLGDREDDQEALLKKQKRR